ncbi:glycerate kinase [Anaerocolumna sp. AGMB13025]|uniref:glycerate kinase n=1 Tax=Anaerocolumna sp. AGMB13025 TaxID=3039116 RepID=UPI00241DF45F|nr:glycerate kinase [Anaerocolumna sp. AGMB13025]WFR57606.1 glycerate kinase [Anaerocolumna sp. AGMB13025]
MKVVVAIDSLKGSLSSIEAGTSIKEGILSVCEAEVIVKPLADGGEGTVEALLAGMGGREIILDVTGPLGKKLTSSYGILTDNRTAVIEMAAAAGIKLVSKEDLNPLYTTTFGVGEMIKDAINKGCRNFIIGIGGSATNDGGLGMLQALGYQFFDERGKLVGPEGRELNKIADFSTVLSLKELKECTFKIACDVTNPLYGPLGASPVFGPQKGATPEIVEILDKGLKNFAEVVKKVLGQDTASYPGTGAAGGLGFAFLTFLNGTLESGINIILEEIGLEEDILDADYVITGEGKLDFQTSMGKAPVGVAKLAKKYGKKVIAFAGGTTKDAAKCNEEGIDAYFSILQLPMTVEEAMEFNTARMNLFSAAAQVFRLIKAVKAF